MRIDKWLWAARFYRTRRLAHDAVVGGRIKVFGARVKPARVLSIGDQLTIRIGEYEWCIEIKELCEQRGPAAAALQLYDESDESQLRRSTQIADRKAQSVEGERTGRPTKRERRQIMRLREMR